jgi:hypothetical protein
MEFFFLLAQAALLVLAGVLVLRVRDELQLLVRQATSPQQNEQMQQLQEELRQTLQEVRATLHEGIVQLEERIRRAEQVLHALEAHTEDTPTRAMRDLQSEPQRVPVERILALADAGCDIQEIARQTGVPEGEVSLVVQLRLPRAAEQRAASEGVSADERAQKNEGTDE